MTSILRSIGIKKSKHQKLTEDWSECREEVDDGVAFSCKYLGCTPMEQPSDVALTAMAIKQIFTMAKAKGAKSVSSVELYITSSNISVWSVKKQPTSSESKRQATEESTLKSCDSTRAKSKTIKSSKNVPIMRKMSSGAIPGDDEKLLNISLGRVSYCSVDQTYDRVVAFVATNANGCHECHAFLTAKRKFAKSIALTISRAFSLAYEKWMLKRQGGTGLVNNNNQADIGTGQWDSSGQPPTSEDLTGQWGDKDEAGDDKENSNSTNGATSISQTSKHLLIDLDVDETDLRESSSPSASSTSSSSVFSATTTTSPSPLLEPLPLSVHLSKSSHSQSDWNFLDQLV